MENALGREARGAARGRRGDRGRDAVRRRGARCFFAGRVVEGLADDLAIDRLAAWRHELAGPLTEAYFNLHDKAQLAAIAAELGVHVDGSKPKSTLVSQLMASSQTKRKLPAELVGKKKSNRAARAERKAAMRGCKKPARFRHRESIAPLEGCHTPASSRASGARRASAARTAADG